MAATSGPLGEAGAAAAQKELVRARELFEQAAAAGDGAGMVGLGDCHYFGRGGLAAEPLVALAWYTLAPTLNPNPNPKPQPQPQPSPSP